MISTFHHEYSRYVHDQALYECESFLSRLVWFPSLLCQAFARYSKQLCHSELTSTCSALANFAYSKRYGGSHRPFASNKALDESLDRWKLFWDSFIINDASAVRAKFMQEKANYELLKSLLEVEAENIDIPINHHHRIKKGENTLHITTKMLKCIVHTEIEFGRRSRMIDVVHGVDLGVGNGRIVGLGFPCYLGLGSFQCFPVNDLQLPDLVDVIRKNHEELTRIGAALTHNVGDGQDHAESSDETK